MWPGPVAVSTRHRPWRIARWPHALAPGSLAGSLTVDVRWPTMPACQMGYRVSRRSRGSLQANFER